MKIFENEDPKVFREVVATLARAGACLEKCEHTLTNVESGQSDEVWFFIRYLGADFRWAEVFSYGDDERIPATEVRSICERLGLSTELFGWTIINDKQVRVDRKPGQA